MRDSHLASIENDPTWSKSRYCFFQGCNDGGVKLTKDGIEIIVRAHSESFRRLGNDYFVISLVMASRESLSLNVSELELLSPAGQGRRPEGFFVRRSKRREPPRAYCLVDDYHSRGRIRTFPGFTQASSTLYRVVANTCYDMIFPGPPPKSNEVFYLDLAGVRSSDPLFRFPLVRFAQN